MTPDNGDGAIRSDQAPRRANPVVLLDASWQGVTMTDEPPSRPAMPQEKWASGSLRICSDTLTPQQVSAALGIQPDSSFDKGSLSSPRNPQSHRRETSVWLLTSGLGNDRWLDEHVAALVQRLEGKNDALRELSASCEAELLLGFGSENGQGGCTIPFGLLTAVGQLGLDLVLDLYPPTDHPDW
jgi:hypothetical protein